MIGTLAVAAGGAAGSLLRYWATLLAARWGSAGFPWSTIAINVVGSFVIGWFAAATMPGGASPASHETRLLVMTGPLVTTGPLVMTGLCGGFTTFSAFSLETFLMIERGEIGLAGSYIAASVIGAIAFLYLGLAATRAAA